MNIFLKIAEKLTGANQIDKLSQLKNRAPIYYILQNSRYPYPNIKFRYTSTDGTEKIIKSLKTKNSHWYGVLLLLVPH